METKWYNNYSETISFSFEESKSLSFTQTMFETVMVQWQVLLSRPPSWPHASGATLYLLSVTQSQLWYHINETKNKQLVNDLKIFGIYSFLRSVLKL